MAGVTRRFNGTVAVDALDIVIPAGSVVGVIGPSGSGKTTTIRMVTGSLAARPRGPWRFWGAPERVPPADP